MSNKTYNTKFFITLFLIIVLIIVLAVHGNWKPEVSALIGAFSSVIFTRLWKSIYKKKAHKK